MSLEHAILGFLNYQPFSGYDLKKVFDTTVRHFWPADQSQIYRTLGRLAEQGCVKMEKVEQSNRPDRKVYHLTDAGRQVFTDWVEQPVSSLRSARVELLAKLRFYDWLALPGVGKLIRDQQIIYQKMLDEWQAEQAQETDSFLQQVYEFRIDQARFIINWLENYSGKLGGVG